MSGAPFKRGQSEPQELEMPATLFSEMFFEEGGFNSRTLGGDLAVANGEDLAMIEEIDPGGAARNLDLDFEEEGKVYVINNTADAAEAITVRNSSDTTLVTISQDELGILYCDGTNWAGVTIATSGSVN